MDNDIDPKPNYLELDEERSKLLEKILLGSSTNARLYSYLNYFQKILSFNRSNIEEAFLSEFLEDYLNVVKRYEVWGNDPELTRKIFEQQLKIKDILFTEDYVVDINNEIARLESQWTDLTNILNGIEQQSTEKRKAYFPVIDNEAPVNCYGLIETITVRINKIDGEDKFIIIPSEKEIEQRIADQIKISWQLALAISKKYVRKHNQYHEVIISFDKKAGFYVGNSLGIALTLTFLEQILKFYNPTYIIKISEGSAFTGGIDTEGNVLNTGEDIIKRKVAAIFYSELNSFVIPKLEETFAYFALKQLKKGYPQRKLKLIPAEDIDDILNRRDLVEIKKQKAIVRTGKFVRNNWISAVATVLLAILFGYLFVMDFDDNPNNVSADGNKIYVINSKGKPLWSFYQPMEKYSYQNPNTFKYMIQLYDIDNDGKNEVIFVQPPIPNSINHIKQSRLVALNNLKDTLWTYTFRDSVVSEREILSSDYSISMIGTTKFENKEVLISWAQNATSFSNAVFLLDIKTGERINKTHWVSGHITGGMIMDINKDNKDDLVLSGIDNGYEEAVLWGLEFKDLDGYRHTMSSYIIKGKPESHLIFYIRIPKLDFENFMGFRSSGIDFASLTYLENDSLIRSHTLSYRDRSMIDRLPLMDYRLKSNLKDFNIYISSSFRVVRDSLVAKGFLDQPYTDTREYIEIQKNNILYWKDSEWVSRKDFDKQ